MKVSVASSTIMLFPLFLWINLLLCPSAPSVMANELSTHNLSQNMDLVSFLSSKSHRDDAIFTDAVQLLESLRSSPSCNRLAATKLVMSCQSIGGKPNGLGSEDYVTLEYTRSLYAARLAICELHGAGTAIPSACSPVAVFAPPQRRNLFGFSTKYKPDNDAEDSVPQHVLESCLRSLESRPQWWTSYSNSRQGAMVICQAARIENEKEDLLNLHRSIIDIAFKLNHGLKEALRAAAAESAEQKAFAEAVGAMRDKLTHDLEDTGSRFQGVVSSIFHDIESRIGLAVTSITSTFGKVHTGATILEEDIRNASNEFVFLHGILGAVHKETLARREQLMQAHQQDTQTQNEFALSLRSSLESLLQGDMARLSQGVETFNASLEWLLGKMSAILRQEAEVSERLRGFEASLEKSEMKAENLQKAQLLQYQVISAQSQEQSGIQTDMRISQALLDKATAAAANLQTMIDETAVRYRETPAFGGLLGNYSAWTLCALLFSMLGMQNPKYALAVLLIGMVHLIATRVQLPLL